MEQHTGINVNPPNMFCQSKYWKWPEFFLNNSFNFWEKKYTLKFSWPHWGQAGQNWWQLSKKGSLKQKYSHQGSKKLLGNSIGLPSIVFPQDISTFLATGPSSTSVSVLPEDAPLLSFPSGCTMMSFPSWQTANSPKFNFCQWVALQLIPSLQTLRDSAASGFGCCCKYLCSIGRRDFNLDKRTIRCQSNSLPEDWGSDTGLRWVLHIFQWLWLFYKSLDQE